MFDDPRGGDDPRDRDDDSGDRDPEDERPEPGHRRDLGDGPDHRADEPAYESSHHDERGRDDEDGGLHIGRGPSSSRRETRIRSARHQGRRWRMPVDDFALARGATAPITSKQNAEHVWEPKFLAEIMACRDPHVAPNVLKPAVGLTVADFLDLYFTNYVEAEGLRDPVAVKGRLKAIYLQGA